MPLTFLDEHKSIRWLYALPFLIAIFQILHRIEQYPHFINHDVALFINGAQLICEGKFPYVDFAEFNPPIIFYIYVMPVWLAQFVQNQISQATSFFILLLILYSLSSSIFILFGKVKPEDWKFLLPMLFGYSILNLPLFYHFAQREHILILLFMPFFVLRWLRQRNTKINDFIAAFIGTIAAIGICIKPFFLLLPISLEAYWFLAKRQSANQFRNPEIISAVSTIILLILTFFLVAPSSMRDAYLIRWVPLAVKGSGAYFCSLQELLLFSGNSGRMLPAIWIIVTICAFALVFRNQNSIIVPLLVWVISGWCIYLLQQKGWQYHSIILLAGYFMLANVELAIIGSWLSVKYLGFLRTFWEEPLVAFAMYGLLLCLFLPLLMRDSFTTCANNTKDPLEDMILYKTCPNDSVLVISSYVHPPYPALIVTKRRAASRYLWTFPLRMYEYLKYKSKNQFESLVYSRAEAKVTCELCEDICRTKPALIAVDKLYFPWGKDHPTSLFSYLEATGFRKVLERYNFIGSKNHFLVWVRKNYATATN